MYQKKAGNYLKGQSIFQKIKTDKQVTIYVDSSKISEADKEPKLHLPNIVQVLTKSAQRNGKSKDQTKAILQTILTGLKSYFDVLNTSQITDERLNQLEDLKELIVKQALVTAVADNKVISSGERKLIQTFASYLVDPKVASFWKFFSYHKDLLKIKMLTAGM